LQKKQLTKNPSMSENHSNKYVSAESSTPSY